MRVRTIVDTLGCLSYSTSDESLLDRDVIVSVGGVPERCANSVLMLAAFGGRLPWKERSREEGILLVHVPTMEGESLDDLMKPPAGVVFVASSCPYEEFLDSFRRLPQVCALLSLRRSQLHTAFLHSYDVRQFAEKAQPIIGNPLVITNSDHRLLTSAGTIPEDREDVREVIEHGYVTDGVKSDLEADGVIRDVRLRRHAVLTENPRFGQRWAHSIVYVHHMEMGRFDVLESDCPITPVDLELIDYAGSLVGIMMERLGLAGGRVGSGSSVLRDLINGSFVNEETMRSQMSLTRLPLGETYVILAVVGQRGAGADYYTRAGRMVAETIRLCLWTDEGGILAILAPVGKSSAPGYDGYGRARKALLANSRLRVVLENNDMYAYASEPFEDLGMAAGRFSQCVELLDAVGEDRIGRIRLFWEDRFRVLACSAKTFDQMEAMIDKRVVAMLLYDRDHGTQYLDTAIMSISCPGSPAEAADALNVHRNTYFYRINKMRELFYLDLKDGDDRLALAFTARIMEGLNYRFHVDLSTYRAQG